MTPTRPYFLRAIYDWIVDNGCTPYLAVFADAPGVQVPVEYVENGEITLNIAPSAVANWSLDNQQLSFSARFSGVSQDIFVPISAILGIFAKENGQGMAFPEEPEYDQDVTQDGLEKHDVEIASLPSEQATDHDDDPSPPSSPSPVSKKARPQLKVVK